MATLVANTCTIDHIVPTSEGGWRSRENTVGACWACNNARGGIAYEVYKKHIARVGERPARRPNLPKRMRASVGRTVGPEWLRGRIVKEETRAVLAAIKGGDAPWTAKPSAWRPYVADLPKHEGIMRDALLKAGWPVVVPWRVRLAGWLRGWTARIRGLLPIR